MGPADALRRTNGVLVRDARTGLFLTALVARLDPIAGSLRYANAGHEHPLLRRRGSRRVREVRSPGAMLGLFEQPSVADRVVTLAPGDLFFVYTDGVTDATASDGARFGLERLVDVCPGPAKSRQRRGRERRRRGQQLRWRSRIPADD